MNYREIVKGLFTSPASTFYRIKNRKITLTDILFSLVIVLTTGSINFLTVIYVRNYISLSFVLYTITTSIVTWALFSCTIHVISNALSPQKYSKLSNTLFGIGISRVPMIIFVSLFFLIFITHRINIVSPVFVMINIITTLWMFYLYTSCISSFYHISIIKSIFSTVASFATVLLITTITNKLIGLTSIPI